MMKTVNLFVTNNERIVTNISQACLNATVKSLKTRYMTLTSYDENNEYTGLEIALCSIDCEKGLVHFEKCKDGYEPIHFTMDVDDDPIIVFNDDEPGVEYHIFEKISDHKINPEIKQGCLYKFKKTFTDEWFLAVVQSVEPSLITFNKLYVTRDKNLGIFRLYQEEEPFSMSPSDTATVERYKKYVVTELCNYYV